MNNLPYFLSKQFIKYDFVEVHWLPVRCMIKSEFEMLKKIVFVEGFGFNYPFFSLDWFLVGINSSISYQ